MKILHISESFEGGVATAVSNYVSMTVDTNTEHYLLCSTRTNKLDSGILEQFSTVFQLPRQHFNAIKTVRDIIDKLRPDVIHCQSSFGGVYGRLGARHFPGLIVYSPHCYAFERQDVGKLTRTAYYDVEKFLRRYTDVVVACSEREKALAEKIGGRKGFRAVFVPNFSALPQKTSGKREKLVVGMGRLAPQKDPAAFAAVAAEVDAEFVWIGDGDDKYKAPLEANGVKITGWKSQKEVQRILSRASVYLHTALWEGFPMTILDAERCGLAIAARKAPYLTGMPKEYTPTIDKLAEVVNEALSSEMTQQKNAQAWREALANNNPKVARERLLEVYNLAR